MSVMIHIMKLQRDWQQKNSGVHIGTITSDLKAAEMAFHRTMFMNVLSGIKYLGLALRGYDERADSFEGNIYHLLLLEAKGDCKMKAWLCRSGYISPEAMTRSNSWERQYVIRY